MFGGVPAKKKQLWRSPGFEPAALRFETTGMSTQVAIITPQL